MPLLRCGAEMQDLLKVSDIDVQVIEDTLAERLGMGVPRADAERQAVDEAIAQAREERQAILDAVAEKVGGLTRPTKAGAIAAQDRAAEGERRARADAKERDQRARADADRGEFALTGSDRAADVAAAGGQTAMFNRRDDAVTDTPAFKRWFDGSKVVDEQGKPLVVYHGTSSDITVFDASRTKAADVIFTTPDPEGASIYAETRRDGGAANVMPLYVSIRNPAIIEADDYSFDALNAALSRKGVDGVLVVDKDGAIKIAAPVSPEQIKSATGNRGTFDPSNPDIRFNRQDSADNAGDGSRPDARPTPRLARPDPVELVARLNAAVSRSAGGAGADTVLPYEPRSVSSDGTLRDIADALGSTVQWFGLRSGLTVRQRSQYGFFNGAQLDGAIYLAAEGNDRPHLAVLGHEMAHEIARNSPGIYADLVDAIGPYINEQVYARVFPGLAVAKNVKTAAGVKEEFIGEVLSDGFMDPKFWAALGEKNPSLLRKMADAVTGLIETVLAKVGYTKRTAPFLTDYEKVMRIAGEAVAKYAETRRADGATDTDTPKFARSSKTKSVGDQTQSEAFKIWSNAAPLVTSAAATTREFKSGERVVLEAYHGTARPDRVGTVFDPKRATSGPMAYFTSEPVLASSYAQGKQDTSLSSEDQRYATWFQFKPPGARSAVDIERAWFSLTTEEKQRVAALAPRVQQDDSGENIVLGGEDVTNGPGGYQQALSESRRSGFGQPNPLRALVDQWLEGGTLYGDEQRFLQVLKLAGFPVQHVEMNDPNATFPFVYKTYVKMRVPLVTTDIPASVREALDAAAKRDRSRAALGGADAWDKNTRTLREWNAAFKADEGADNSYVWTSIPDKVTEVFRSLGYDGIIDRSGKGGGTEHPVYVPFSSTQVKSAIGNRGTFDDAKKDIRFNRQDDPKSPWRDETGRLQFAPGAWLYDKLGEYAGPILARVGLKAASPELRRIMRQMKIDVQKAQETAAAVAAETNVMTADERAMVSDLIEREMKAGVTPPAHAVRLAAMINTSMETQTDELVRLGMLTKDSADRWRGQYLPRYYESKLTKKAADVWADAMRIANRRPRAMAGIRGKHLKGRGLYETIPENQLDDYKALGWEVRDPDFEAGEAKDGTVQVWRDFTRAERDDMKEIRDAGFRFVMGYMQTQRDIALGRMFETIADDAGLSARNQAPSFDVQVPASTVQGTGAKTYGKLAGRWVSRETLSQLSAIEESQSEAIQMYRKAMGLWKEGRVVLNPVSHVNNIVSNLTMAHFAGVGYHRGDKYLAAARDFATKAPGITEAKDAGLFLGTLSEAELFNTLPEDLKALAMKQEGTGEKVGRTAMNVLTFWLRKPMGWAYQAEDSFFRYLVYKEARGRGLEPGDAVDYAQKYIFTYDDLPKGARVIRDLALPFVSYTYKAVPALLHTALTHPLRMAAPAAVLWSINAAAYAIAAGDDDDDWAEALRKYLQDPQYREAARKKEKLEREFLPSWMKGNTALMTPKTIRLGMDEVTKLPLFIDVARIIPGGDLFDVAPNAGGLPLPAPITPSHPLLSIGVAMLGNRDLFRGKDIVDTNDTTGEAAAKRTDWMWKQLSPAIAVGNNHWERGMNALAQATGKPVERMPDALGGDATGVGRDGLPVQPKYAAMQTFGVKVRPIDLEMSEKLEAGARKKMIDDINIEVRRLKRLNAKGAISDAALERERELAITKRERLREGLTVDGKEKD